MTPLLSHIRLEYTQDKDGDDLGVGDQNLIVELTHCGGQPYFVLRTERWAFDKIADVLWLLSDVEKCLPLFARNSQ